MLVGSHFHTLWVLVLLQKIIEIVLAMPIGSNNIDLQTKIALAMTIRSSNIDLPIMVVHSNARLMRVFVAVSYRMFRVSLTEEILLIHVIGTSVINLVVVR